MQTTNSPFSFTVARKGASSNDAPLFSTRGQRLIFKVHSVLTQSQVANADTPHRSLCIENVPFEAQAPLHQLTRLHQPEMTRLAAMRSQA